MPRARLLVAVLGVPLLVVACRTVAPPPTLVPDPTRAPLPRAARTLDEDEQRTVLSSLAAAERGDFRKARTLLGSLPPEHPVTRLAALEIGFLEKQPVADEALALAGATGEWVAALQLALDAARAEGASRLELVAAQRLAAAQPGPEADQRVEDARQGLIRSLLREADTALMGGDLSSAQKLATEVLATEAGSTAARIVLARVYLGEKAPEKAASLVPAIPDSSEGLEVKGRVAAALGQWSLAEDLFARLPSKYPDRCALLSDARRQLRLSNAPPYVLRALDAAVVDRGELAALLAWEVPGLDRRDGGNVPVYEDVVQLPEGRDIVTVVRAGLMQGDDLARRFSPGRALQLTPLEKTISSLALLLGKPAIDWCGADERAGCTPQPVALDGRTVAAIIRRVVGEGDLQCNDR